MISYVTYVIMLMLITMSIEILLLQNLRTRICFQNVSRCVIGGKNIGYLSANGTSSHTEIGKLTKSSLPLARVAHVLYMFHIVLHATHRAPETLWLPHVKHTRAREESI